MDGPDELSSFLSSSFPNLFKFVGRLFGSFHGLRRLGFGAIFVLLTALVLLAKPWLISDGSDGGRTVVFHSVVVNQTRRNVPRSQQTAQAFGVHFHRTAQEWPWTPSWSAPMAALLARHFSDSKLDEEDVDNGTANTLTMIAQHRDALRVEWPDREILQPFHEGLTNLSAYPCPSETDGPECALWLHPKLNDGSPYVHKTMLKCCISHRIIREVLRIVVNVVHETYGPNRTLDRIWAAYGTLLGIKRHNSTIIPWDNDADVMLDFSMFDTVYTKLNETFWGSPVKMSPRSVRPTDVVRKIILNVLDPPLPGGVELIFVDFDRMSRNYSVHYFVSGHPCSLLGIPLTCSDMWRAFLDKLYPNWEQTYGARVQDHVGLDRVRFNTVQLARIWVFRVTQKRARLAAAALNRSKSVE